MNIKRLLVILPLVAVLVAGCSTVRGIFGKSSVQLQKQTDKITEVNNQLSDLQGTKINQVSQLSYGTDYSLSKATNTEPAVAVAKELNERVQAIAGLPTLQQEKAITSLVQNLISNSVAGNQMLLQKDNEISALQKEETILVDQKEKVINNQIALAQQIALQADASKAELQKYQGWMGLSAVFMGLKEFLTHAIWILVGGSVIFLILRMLASTNPIASAIFSIFDTMLSWVVNTIKLIAPKALSLAGTVEKSVYNSAASALSAIVDSVETVKLTGDASGRQPTIQELLATAELSMTPEDKLLIDKIKVQLGWVKPSVVNTTPKPILTPSAVVAPLAPQVVLAPAALSPVPQASHVAHTGQDAPLNQVAK